MGRGFGINATVPHDVARIVAAEAERLGYTSFWTNDPGNADGLATLAAAAEVTQGVRLGIGVIPLDRRPAETIAADVARFGLPQERLLLGVGSGGDRKGLARVRDGVATLQQLLTAPILISALGPKMCRLAGEVAAGVVFNWLTPEYTAASAALVLEGAMSAGRPRPLLTAHVRCALLPQADARLAEQAARYGSIPQYAANFARMGVSPRQTVVQGADAATLQGGIAAHEAHLDETIVRAITADDSAASILELLRACAPAAR
jgi:alkanesulfonate monooxygenase SsuD/methylene tetrahydromethanopterin reductase-like flavin-dependent oxidoreductase (luciferase family)